MNDCYFLIRSNDHTGYIKESGKVVLDFQTALNFFGADYTATNVAEIVLTLNEEWNKKYAGKKNVCILLIKKYV